MAMTIKQTKWIKDGKVTNVWVKSTNTEEWVEISGYNPFPFYADTKFKTSKKVFENWMKENGYTPIYKVTRYHSVIRIK